MLLNRFNFSTDAYNMAGIALEFGFDFGHLMNYFRRGEALISKAGY